MPFAFIFPRFSLQNEGIEQGRFSFEKHRFSGIPERVGRSESPVQVSLTDNDQSGRKLFPVKWILSELCQPGNVGFSGGSRLKDPSSVVFFPGLSIFSIFLEKNVKKERET